MRIHQVSFHMQELYLMILSNKLMTRLIQLMLVSSLLITSMANYAAESSKQILQRLESVAKNTNYEGVFLYQNGKKLQSIRIIHRANEQGEVERLVSLNGVAREVIRMNEMLTYVYPEGESVQEDRRPLGRGFPVDLLNRLVAAADYYQINYGQEERIAGQHGQKLLMKPIDNYRYGYQLWVDKDHNLLLQADLINEQGDVLESFSFSTIDIDIEIPDQSLKASMQGNEMTWNRDEQKEKRMMAVPADKKGSGWHIKWLPAGFHLIAQKSTFKLDNGAPVEHRVYSDGLSTVSIFFEKIKTLNKHLRGGSNRGSVNVFGLITSTHFITLIGEVPDNTIKKIADSITFMSVND